MSESTTPNEKHEKSMSAPQNSEPKESSSEVSPTPQTVDSSESQTSEDTKKLQELYSQLETLKSESTENYNKYLRAMADQENLRRRTEKEKRDIRQFALESFAKDLLPVLDSFHQALDGKNKEEESESKSFYEGINMVRKLLVETLEKNGLTSIEAKDKAFDPNVHQAIRKVESKDVNEQTIQDEYSIGYTLNGRLLRPSMVSVLVPSKE